MGQPYPYPLLAQYFRNQCKKCDAHKSQETIQKEIDAIMELERQREEQFQQWPASATTLPPLTLRPPFQAVVQCVRDFFGYGPEFLAWNQGWGPDSQFRCQECAKQLWGIDIFVEQTYADGSRRFPNRPLVQFACQECRQMTPNFSIIWH